MPVWVRRHPLDVVASGFALPFQNESEELWQGLVRADRVPVWCPPPSRDDRIAVVASLTGLAMSTCAEVADRHRSVIVVGHETLCRNRWSTNRVTAEVPGQSRTRLDLEQQQTARRVLAPFPIAGDYAELA